MLPCLSGLGVGLQNLIDWFDSSRKLKLSLAESGKVLALGARLRRFESCTIDYGGLIQLAESLICNQEVFGSSPKLTSMVP